MLIVPVLLGLAAVAAFIYTVRTERRRREALAAEARSLGFEFAADPPAGHAARYRARGPVARPGASANLITSRVGDVEWELFDFTYRQRFRRGGEIHYRYGVVAARRPGTALPAIRIRPERWFDAIGKAVGFEDVRLGDASFDARYHVTTDAPAGAVESVLGPAAREVLMRLPAYHWDLRDDTVMLWRRSFYAPHELRDMMAAVESLLRTVPASTRPADQAL